LPAEPLDIIHGVVAARLTSQRPGGVAEDSRLLGSDVSGSVVEKGRPFLLWTAWPWGWRQHDPSKCQYPLTHRHSTTCQKTPICKALRCNKTFTVLEEYS